MKTRRRTYTATTPSSLFPKSLSAKHIIQSCKAKKMNKCNKNWDIDIPTELMQEILSHLGLKANIQASAVCKTWCETAISVRKWQPRPWLFYLQKGSKDGTYILYDTLRRRSYIQNFPELKHSFFHYSRDGWLLACAPGPFGLFLFNPFTSERVDLPEESGNFRAFSAPPTSSSCFVISVENLMCHSILKIKTWRPGETVWTTHCFENKLKSSEWEVSVFSSGMFYFLSGDAHLSVFNPSRATWNILPVKPLPTLTYLPLSMQVVLTEHEGDIFFMHRNDRDPSVFKLNLKQNLWEEKRDLGGLTIFAGDSTCTTRAGLSVEERNRIYEERNRIKDKNRLYYYSHGDDESSHPPTPELSQSILWVDPPHNNFKLL